MKLLPLVGAIIVGTSVISGCSNDNDPAAAAPGAAPIVRVAPLATQTATISIADPDGTPVATVTSQPADMVLTAAATSTGATTLDLVLGLTNNAARPLSNPKTVVDTAGSTLGTATIAGTGTIGTDAFAALGALSLDTAGANDPATADMLSVSVIDAVTDPMVIVVTIPTQDAMIFVSDSTSSNSTPELNRFDISDAQSDTQVDLNHLAFDQKQGNAGLREGDRSRDGKYAFFGHRQMPMVAVYNTITGEASSIDLSVENRSGSVDSVVVSPDGLYAYASFVDGDHMYVNYSSGALRGVELVKIDISTMSVMSRLRFDSEGGNARPRRLSIASDGTTGALNIGNFRGEIAVIDLESMTINKMLDVSASGYDPRHAAISPDGAYVYVGQNDDEGDADQMGELDVITVADGTITPVTLTTTGSRTRALRFDSTGRLFFVRDGAPDLAILTFTGGDYSAVTGETEFDFTGTPDGFDFGPYGEYYYLCSGGAVVKVDVATNTEAYNTSVGSDGHMCVVTAY